MGWPGDLLEVLRIEPYFALADPLLVDDDLAGETGWEPGADMIRCAAEAGVLPDEDIRHVIGLANRMAVPGDATADASDRSLLHAVCQVLASLLDNDRRFETESTPLYDELLRSFPGLRPPIAQALADVWPLIQPVRG